MHAKEIHTFLHQFFRENQCEILHGNDYYLTVQLTIDMDKKIMNRPFYWRYIESVNDPPNPAQLTLITDMQNIPKGFKGEVIHPGSPRLHQLFRVTREMGRFVKLSEKTEAASQNVLTPWLGVNYKVSFISHQTKEMLHSVGMNLMTGAVVKDFQETVMKRDMAPYHSVQAFHLPYTITPVRALDRLEAIVRQLVGSEDHAWMEEAQRRWRKDLAVLEYFHADQKEKSASYKREKEAMEERFKPIITVEISNGGLFYLI